MGLKEPSLLPKFFPSVLYRQNRWLIPSLHCWMKSKNHMMIWRKRSDSSQTESNCEYIVYVCSLFLFNRKTFSSALSGFANLLVFGTYRNYSILLISLIIISLHFILFSLRKRIFHNLPWPFISALQIFWLYVSCFCSFFSFFFNFYTTCLIYFLPRSCSFNSALILSVPIR